jgi:hypothetical protein
VISISVCPRCRFCTFILVLIRSVVLPVPVVFYLGQSSILSQDKGAGVRGGAGDGENIILYGCMGM